MLPAKVNLEPWLGDPLIAFREQFEKALESDDDSLTQFHSEEKLRKLLTKADSLPKLLSALHKLRVT
jgi:hypothetical protein